MIICNNCGAENLFDGAINCKKCHQPLHQNAPASSSIERTTQMISIPAGASTTAAPSSENKTLARTAPVETDQKNLAEASPDFDIDIKEVDFDSRPSDMSIAQPEGQENPEKEAPPPETIQKELTLYRDDEMQVRMEHTPDGPAITLTNMLDFSQREPAEIEKPETIIPAINESDLAGIGSDEQQHVTKKIIINPQIEKRSRVEQVQKETVETGDDFSTRDEKQNVEKPSPEFLQKLSGEQIKPKGVAFFSGNTVRISGMKLSGGDKLLVNDKEYELIEKKTSKTPLYAILGTAILAIFAVLFFLNSGKSTEGQIVGITRDLSTGQIIPYSNITIKELGRTVQVNQAGFFVFEKIPEGVYTIESAPGGYLPISERLTVLKNKTSTITLGFRLPESMAKPADIETNPGDNQTVDPKLTGFRLSVTPSEAKIYIDGRLAGTGTAETKLTYGKHKISLKYAGYKEYSQTIDISDNSPKSLNITLEKLPAAPPPKSDIEIASELEGDSKFEKALEIYQAILRKNPNDVNALLGQARCYRAIGNTEFALSSYLKASKSAADKGDTDNHLVALGGVLDINPNYLTALYNRGIIYFNRRDYPRAIADFSKVITIDPRHLNAHYKLAESYHKSGNFAAALEAYDQTLKLNFADAKPYAYMAEIYLSMGDIKNTRKYFDKFEKNADMPTKNKFADDPEWKKVKEAVGR